MKKLELVLELLDDLDDAQSDANIFDKLTKLELIANRCGAIIATHHKDSTLSKIASHIQVIAMGDTEEMVEKLPKQAVQDASK